MRTLENTMSSSSWWAELWLRQNAGQTGSGEPGVPCYYAVIDETIASSRANSNCQEHRASVRQSCSRNTVNKVPQRDCARRVEFLQIHFARLAELSLPDARNAVCWSSRSAVTIRPLLETLRCRNAIVQVHAQRTVQSTTFASHNVGRTIRIKGQIDLVTDATHLPECFSRVRTSSQTIKIDCRPTSTTLMAAHR